MDTTSSKSISRPTEIKVISSGQVNFDKPMRERLRKAYKKAVKDYKSQFDFEGNQYLTHYAKYLLEYLDMKMGK